MKAWKRQPNVAVVESPGRRILLDLTRLHQAPVVLEGAALQVHDTIDDARDTAAIIALLAKRHPDVPDLPEQVRSCLDMLASLALIHEDPSTRA